MTKRSGDGYNVSDVRDCASRSGIGLPITSKLILPHVQQRAPISFVT